MRQRERAARALMPAVTGLGALVLAGLGTASAVSGGSPPQESASSPTSSA